MQWHSFIRETPLSREIKHAAVHMTARVKYVNHFRLRRYAPMEACGFKGRDRRGADDVDLLTPDTFTVDLWPEGAWERSNRFTSVIRKCCGVAGSRRALSARTRLYWAALLNAGGGIFNQAPQEHLRVVRCLRHEFARLVRRRTFVHELNGNQF